jgi:murein DD-endopeptidase MepM/ murein hydrolase activator NlpD
MFTSPVDPRFPPTSYYGKEGPDYGWSLDPDNGLWLATKSEGGVGNHRGVDYACPHGTLIRAMADGFIVRASHEDAIEHSRGAGLHILQLVMLPGFDSWTLRYTHLSSVCVKPGQRVKQHDIIGQTGTPHLHIDLMDLRRQWRPIPICDD